MFRGSQDKDDLPISFRQNPRGFGSLPCLGHGAYKIDGGMIYEESTQGILIRVRPQFSLADSSLDQGRFVFTYHVEMENRGEEDAQLLFRHWKIHDSGGDDSEVNGEGVVGTTAHPESRICSRIQELLHVKIPSRIHGGELHLPAAGRVPIQGPGTSLLFSGLPARARRGRDELGDFRTPPVWPGKIDLPAESKLQNKVKCAKFL